MRKIILVGLIMVGLLGFTQISMAAIGGGADTFTCDSTGCEVSSVEFKCSKNVKIASNQARFTIW